MNFEYLKVTMSEIIKKRLRESTGKEIIVYTDNGFRYKGINNNSDETYLELIDNKIQGYKVIKISQIMEVEIPGGAK